MGHKINLNGTVYEITKGKTKAGGVVRDLLHGITADPVTGETKKITLCKKTSATVMITGSSMVTSWSVIWNETGKLLNLGTYEIPIGNTLRLTATARITLNGENVGTAYNLVVDGNVDIQVSMILNAINSHLIVTTGGAG